MMRSMLSATLTLICLSSSITARAEEPFATPVGSDAGIEGSKMFFYAAVSYYATGDYVQAFKNLEKAWELTHNAAYAYDATLCLWRLDEPFRARRWLRRVPESHPGYARLMRRILDAINADDEAWHYEFGCDEQKRFCGYGTNWSRLVVSAP